MHRKLIIEAFEKAKKEEGFIKKTHVSRFLSEYITEHTKEPYGEKIIRVHYNNAMSSAQEKVELKSFAAESLANYLGNHSYKAYLNKSQVPEFEREKRHLFTKNKYQILLFILAVVIAILLVSSITLNTQRWMVWQEDHYEEAAFDTEKYNIGDLKLYKEERMEKFKKIEPNCNTLFFKSNGIENLWYGKNKNKELEFFTSLGLHPDTGKTLKPITAYMIKKHICDTY
jgi:hypothetical protein